MDREQFPLVVITGLITLAGTTLILFLTPLWNNITKNWPEEKSKKYFKWILSVIIFAFFSGIILLSYPTLKNFADEKGFVLQSPIQLRPPFYRKIQGTKIGLKEPFKPPALPEKQITCDADYCSDFNKEDWDGWTTFRESAQYSNAFIPSIERKVFDTARLWYKKFQPPPAFKIELTAKSYHPNMGNIVISYGTIWRCIIAESNYNTITCEAEKPFQRLPSKHLTGKEKQPIKPETDILVTLETILTTEDKIKIVMNMEYIDIDSNKSGVDFDFLVGLPTPKPSEENNYIGVGIIDPTREDPAVEFKGFKLWKR